MRALQLDSPNTADAAPLRLVDLSVPEPSSGEVRVRIRCCAVCRTDLHIVEGDLSLPMLPIVPGHQIVGVVDALGPGVRALRPGERIGIPWLYSTDGTCAYCARGNENLCEQARFTGYHVNGGFAEYCVVREEFSYSLPEVFRDEHAAPLLCAGVIGYRAYQLCGAQSGQRLGLYGFGGSAHLILQLARHHGCEVFVFTRGRGHRDLAEQLGAAWTGSAEDTPPRPLHAAIIFAPAGKLVADALRVLDKAGTIALAGITMTQIPALDYSLLYQERIVRSVANSTRSDCRDFLRQAAEVPIRPRTQIYPLNDANRALLDLKYSRVEGAGVLQISA